MFVYPALFLKGTSPISSNFSTSLNASDCIFLYYQELFYHQMYWNRCTHMSNLVFELAPKCLLSFHCTSLWYLQENHHLQRKSSFIIINPITNSPAKRSAFSLLKTFMPIPLLFLRFCIKILLRCLDTQSPYHHLAHALALNVAAIFRASKSLSILSILSLSAKDNRVASFALASFLLFVMNAMSHLYLWQT